MNNYAQIFIGGAGKTRMRWAQIEDALPKKHLDGIILGWAENAELYRQAQAYARRFGLKYYLWLPVFAEWKALTGQSDYLLSGGRPAEGVRFNNAESFDFCCVSEPGNIDKLLAYYERTFSGFAFDGVFLDRIRYPSFTAGIDAFFGCHCPSCLERYAELGLSETELQDCSRGIHANIADKTNVNPLGLRAYVDGVWYFYEELTEKLVTAKCAIIQGSVRRLAEGLRGFVPELGLDLLPPFISRFAGQSYEALAPLADFIKPMLYQYTDTPAGFRFELTRMVRAVSSAEASPERGDFIRGLLGIPEDGDLRGLMQTELRSLEKLREKVTVGIETHTAPEKPPILPEQIADNLELIVEHGFRGVTACWNILEASRENLQTIFKLRR